MKILHTADWHFGKQLHKHSLAEDMQLFLDWLYSFIKEEGIDILLISGDVFDVTNPSNSDKQQYYQFLKTVRNLGIKTIITGGNHDSINHLNAPKDYFIEDDIFVLGGATEKLEDEIVPLKVDEETVVIAAVPFLRDKDLRHRTTDVQFSSREEAIQIGLQNHYQTLLELIKQKYSTTPTIAMGHLFAVGSSTSDSERDIHIGNSGAVNAGIFSGYDYVALGHIHKPQIIQGNNTIRYSGSPIALSFSEKKDEKQIIVLTIEDGVIQAPKKVLLPKFRNLIRISKSLKEIKEYFVNYENKRELPALIELEVKEERYDLQVIYNTNAFIDEFNSTHECQIVTTRYSFTNEAKDPTDLFEKGTSIKDLNTLEVFEKCIEVNYDEDNTAKINELKNTFTELLDIFHNNEEL